MAGRHLKDMLGMAPLAGSVHLTVIATRTGATIVLVDAYQQVSDEFFVWSGKRLYTIGTEDHVSGVIFTVNVPRDQLDSVVTYRTTEDEFTKLTQGL